MILVFGKYTMPNLPFHLCEKALSRDPKILSWGKKEFFYFSEVK